MTRKSFIHSLLVAPIAGLVGKKAVAGYEIHPEKYYDAWVAVTLTGHDEDPGKTMWFDMETRTWHTEPVWNQPIVWTEHE